MSDREVKDFIEATNPFQDGLLGQIQSYAYENNIPIISREASGFISLLLSLKRPKKILELGCAIGYSSIMMSQFLDKNGFIITIEHSDKMCEIAKKNISLAGASCIHLIHDEVEKVLPMLEHKFDVIFMDAAKGQYVKILPFCLRLLADDGIIIADDILQGGNVVKDRLQIPRRQRTIHTRMNEFINEMFNNKWLRSNIFNIGDGVIVSQKISGE